MDEINYSKLRLDVLEKLVCSRMIECKDNKTDMVRQLRLDDEGEYVRKTIVEKQDKDRYLIGIDSSLHDLMIEMGKLVETGEAVRSHYAYGRHYYISRINILDNGLD
jgi:hypothetical protein